MTHPFIPAPNCALVEMVYSAANQIIENTFHVRANAPFSAGDLGNLATLVFDAWDNSVTNGWKAMRGSQITLTQVKCRALDSPSSPVFIYVLPVPRGGTNGGTTYMPPNATFAFTMQTGLAGRSFRGRIYAPPLTNNQVQAAPNQGLVTAAYASQGLLCLNQLVIILTAYNATWKMVVVSYYNNGAWRLTATITPIISFAFADLAIDSQRRRLPGRGH